jgi:hypothetical protein
MLVDPTATNPNLAAQGGLFTPIRVPIEDKAVPALDTLVEQSGDPIDEDVRLAIYKFAPRDEPLRERCVERPRRPGALAFTWQPADRNGGPAARSAHARVGRHGGSRASI